MKNFDPLTFLEKKEARRYDRFAQFGVAAADEAMRGAGLAGAPEGVAPERFGVIFGSGIGGISTMEAQHDLLKDRGPGRVSPFFIPMFIPEHRGGPDFDPFRGERAELCHRFGVRVGRPCDRGCVPVHPTR